MAYYNDIVQYIKKLTISNTIIHERYLEADLKQHLEKQYTVTSQKKIKSGRNDLVINYNGYNICIEIKKTAISTHLQQIDKYIPYYPHGIILVCWKASQTVRDTISLVKKNLNTPLELIELRQHQGML